MLRRMRRLERLVAIALYLGARRRVRASDVADRFGVSLRTVYRDMQALGAAGFPVEGNAGDGYRLSQESFLRPLALDEDEAEALSIAAQALTASVDGRMREALATATAKLHAALRPASRRRIAQLEARIAVPSFVRSTAPSATMTEAIRERQAASIRYLDPRNGRQTRRTIEPVGLVCRGDAWWLVAWCRTREDARAFRVDCISASPEAVAVKWMVKRLRHEGSSTLPGASIASTQLAQLIFIEVLRAHLASSGTLPPDVLGEPANRLPSASTSGLLRWRRRRGRLHRVSDNPASYSRTSRFRTPRAVGDADRRASVGTSTTSRSDGSSLLGSSSARRRACRASDGGTP
jgi:biotin operon repressor